MSLFECDGNRKYLMYKNLADYAEIEHTELKD